MNERSCGRCAYVGRVRDSEPEELICVNCPVAPGELVHVRRDGTCPDFEAIREPPLRPAPPPPPNDKICYIPLTKGHYAMVDAADYPELSKYRWHALVTSNNVYAARYKDGTTAYMHREIMQPPPGMVTDHIDHNGRNNCRRNLRNYTWRQNLWNSRGSGGASGFKNICYDGKMRQYYAKIQFNERIINLGCFKNPVEAARVRDRKALDLYGPYAFINLPQDLEPRPVPPDPSHPERPMMVTGPRGYLRCPPYRPPAPDGRQPTGTGIEGVHRILRVITWVAGHPHVSGGKGRRRHLQRRPITRGQSSQAGTKLASPQAGCPPSPQPSARTSFA